MVDVKKLMANQLEVSGVVATILFNLCKLGCLDRIITEGIIQQKYGGCAEVDGEPVRLGAWSPGNHCH